MIENKPIIIANWKMKLGVSESIELAKKISKEKFLKAEVVLCPSFTSLSETGKILNNNEIKLGAQDCFWESDGAYTGEVSAKQLKELGCEFVILGHSERRQYLNETDEMIHQKVKMALSARLIPIICVGETFLQRQEGAKDYILIQQTTKALEGIDLNLDQKIIIAYEPVWVIGSGQAIKPSEAEDTHQVIRQSLFDIFPSLMVENNFRIIYGGSVDSGNVRKFVELENTSGVLVGGASLKAEGFISLVKNIG